MSAVRMCDGCGRIFPEGEEGSTMLSGVRSTRDDRGRARTEETTQDRCALCSGAGTVSPRIAVTANPTLRQTLGDTDV